MKYATAIPASALRHRQSEAGSAILTSLALVTVTLVAVGAAMFEASNRYRASHQSFRWSQAEHGAEAGAEIALLTAANSSWTTDSWSGTPGSPGAAAVTKSVTLSSASPSTGTVSARLAVDTVSMSGSEWLRIRSTGVADMAGGALAGIDTRDIVLRKLSLRRDRGNGTSLTSPQATRTIEVLAKPNSPFQQALLLDKKFNMSGGGIVDSFDSSDPAKSTGNLYDATKRQSNGDIGVNDTQNASDLKGTFVYGDIAYSGAAIKNTSNVQGSVTTPFSKPVAPVPVPTWTSFNALPSVINNTMTLTGGAQSSPARYKVSSVTVPGGKILTLAPHAVGVESYVEIWVTGNFTTSGSGYILQQNGVHVTYHIEGDVTVSGSSFNNQANVAANNIINVITPAVGVTQKVTVSGGGTFIGVMNAPSADYTISGSANYSGALIGKTMVISGGASVHYDEALANLSGGAGYGYKVASWVEAVR